MDEFGRIRDQRLRRTLDLCAAAHPFYRRRWRSLGLAPSDIGGLTDISKLPLTTKSDYMAAPEEFRLDPALMAGTSSASFEETTLWNVAYTTGTSSGRPSPFFNTTHDQYTIMLQARRCAGLEGMRTGDVLANLIPLPPMPTGGFLVVGRTAEAIGIPVVFGLTGARNAELPIHRGLDEAIDILAAAEPTVFWGIPSFLRRFFRRARERHVAFPRARMIVTTGEPVSEAMQSEYIDHLRSFGAAEPQLRLRYSFTEMQGGLMQCCNGATLQNVTPDLYHLEVVDPASGRVLGPGEEGALALTHLHRRGTVLLRYLVGDVVRLELSACPQCGTLGERLMSRPRRADALLKVKGLLVNPAVLVDALTADPAVREFQIAVRKESPTDPDAPDVLEVRIEAEAGEHPRLAAELPDILQRLVRIRPTVVFAPPGAIHDPLRALKARRVVDER